MTTVHVRQGRYATEGPSGAPPDIVVERIADLLAIDLARLFA